MEFVMSARVAGGRGARTEWPNVAAALLNHSKRHDKMCAGTDSVGVVSRCSHGHGHHHAAACCVPRRQKPERK